MSRLRTLRSGSGRTAAAAATIRAAADNDTVAVVRLKLLYTRHHRPVRHVEAYDADFGKVLLDPDVVDAIDFLVRDTRPDIDWIQDHDYHLDTGMLRRSPRVGDRGGIPGDDKTFGGTDPVFLTGPAGVPAAPGPDAAPRSAA